MKVFAPVAAGVALLSTASAATVTLQETPCIALQTNLTTFDIELGTLVAKDLPSVCGLAIVSAHGADAAAIECQAFKDAAGTQPGSAKFSLIKPALIATNPVQERAILCTLRNASSTPSSLATFIASATGTAVPALTDNSTIPSATAAPTQPSDPGVPTGAAARTGMSVAALALGIAALML